jgi:hypothetical protein
LALVGSNGKAMVRPRYKEDKFAMKILPPVAGRGFLFMTGRVRLDKIRAGHDTVLGKLAEKSKPELY